MDQPLRHRTHRLGIIRDADVLVRQDERADRRVQREAVHALAPRQDELRRATVHAVTSGHQLVARLQDVLEAALAQLVALVDGEDRARRHIAVNVGRAVQRVERDAVLG
jgi:hypothetical protein